MNVAFHPIPHKYCADHCRQVRNAFQTAIALAEHKSKTGKPGDPLPVLGEAQFKVIASGFEKFDEYLIETLGATEGQKASKDEWRADGWYAGMPGPAPQYPTNPGVHLASSTRPFYSYQGKTAPGPPKAAPESSSDDSDSDVDSDDERRHRRHGKGKVTAALPTEQAHQADSSIDMEQYRAFLEYQRQAAATK